MSAWAGARARKEHRIILGERRHNTEIGDKGTTTKTQDTAQGASGIARAALAISKRGRDGSMHHPEHRGSFGYPAKIRDLGRRGHGKAQKTHRVSRGKARRVAERGVRNLLTCDRCKQLSFVATTLPARQCPPRLPLFPTRDSGEVGAGAVAKPKGFPSPFS